MGLEEIRKNKKIMFDTCPSIYWDDIQKVSWLQQRILVYSIAYYELNSNIIPDDVYDILSHQLAEMQNELSEKELKETTYGYVMDEFSGSGFDLANKLTLDDYSKLSGIAINVIEMSSKVKRSMEKLNENVKSLLEVEIEEEW